jgi:hypothetical protein
MGRPVFRVIQTHFAASGNVGAVAAKEEVWEVSAQLTGYALSVLLLQQLQDAGGWELQGMCVWGGGADQEGGGWEVSAQLSGCAGGWFCLSCSLLDAGG